jgi:hypothetical protein
MRNIFLLVLVLLGGCVTAADIKVLRCDVQRLEDSLHEVRLRAKGVTPLGVENLIKTREGLREMECVTAEIDDSVLCCKKGRK